VKLIKKHPEVAMQKTDPISNNHQIDNSKNSMNSESNQTNIIAKRNKNLNISAVGHSQKRSVNSESSEISSNNNNQKTLNNGEFTLENGPLSFD
jgi:hypothetical protein